MKLLASALRFHLFLGTLAVAMLVAGCGDNGGGGSSDGKSVVRFATFWSEPGDRKALDARIALFEEQHPDIDVQVEELSYNDGKSKLLLAFNSQTAPDVIELGSDWIAQFSSAGVLQEQSLERTKANARFTPAVMEPAMWEGKLYALPWVIDTRVLYFNKDLLGSAGVDTTVVDTLWEDVLPKAEAVRAKGGDFYGFGVQGPDPHRLYKKIVPFFWSNGGEILDSSGKPVLNSQANIEALRMYMELARTGLIETQKGLDDKFVAGKLGYWISGAWLASRIQKDNPGMHFGMAPIPTFTGKTSVSFLGGQYLSINASSKVQAEAQQLVDFLSSSEQSLAFCKELGKNAPADKSIESDPYMQSPMRIAYTHQLRSARITPVHPKWLDIEEIIETEVSEALLGRKSEEQALNDAQYKVTQLLANGSADAGDSTEH